MNVQEQRSVHPAFVVVVTAIARLQSLMRSGVRCPIVRRVADQARAPQDQHRVRLRSEMQQGLPLLDPAQARRQSVPQEMRARRTG